MGAGQKPELKELTSGIQVAQEGTEVRLSAKVSHDTLSRLQAPARPTPETTPASRPAPRPTAKK
jgi:hypothetical protein